MNKMENKPVEDKLDDTYEQIMSALKELDRRLDEKPIAPKRPVPKKNSNIHILINTEEKKKLESFAREEGIPFAEWCRRKLRGVSQLNRIEGKIDRLLK